MSKTAVGWIEGGSQHLMAPEVGNYKRQGALVDLAAPSEAHRDPKYSVPVLEVRYQAFAPRSSAARTRAGRDAAIGRTEELRSRMRLLR